MRPFAFPCLAHACMQVKEAHAAMALCLGAWVQLFGRELVVVQSMARLASIEGQMGQVGVRCEPSHTIGRELVVVHSMARMASIEGQMRQVGVKHQV